MNFDVVPHHVSKPTRLPTIIENKTFQSDKLIDLRNCQSKTFRRLLQRSFDSRSRLSFEGIIMLKQINGGRMDG